MNNYPKWWDTTITIFNKYEDPQTHVIRWYSTVVTGTFWKYEKNRVIINNTTLETTNILCRIRKDSRFLEKSDWINIPNDDMDNYFTLSEGDIIVKGEVTDNIDEYQQGYRSTDLLRKYKKLQGCMTIENALVNVGSGRGNEHYRVTGI